MARVPSYVYAHTYIHVHYTVHSFSTLYSIHLLSGNFSEIVPVNGTDIVGGVCHLLYVYHQCLLLNEVHGLHTFDEGDFPLTLHHTAQQEDQ